MKQNLILTRNDVLDFLKTQKLMCLATYGEHPWIASVYYSFDNELNLYFLSDPSTLHVKHIQKNKHVAAAIVDSHQKPSDAKKGLQVYGTVTEVSGDNKIRHYLRHWKNSLSITDPELSFENMKKGLFTGRMYKLTPKKIKLFDQNKFKVDDGKEPVLEL